MKPHPAPAADHIERIARGLGEVLAATPFVQFAFGLGSFFEGLPHRDIDVAVTTSAGTRPSLRELAAVAERCEALARRPVDLRLLEEDEGAFAFSVAAGRLLYARDPDAACAWAESRRRMAWDVRVLQDQALRDMPR